MPALLWSRSKDLDIIKSRLDGNDSLKCLLRKEPDSDIHSDNIGPQARIDSRDIKGDYYLSRASVDRWARARVENAVPYIPGGDVKDDNPCATRWNNMINEVTARMWGIFDAPIEEAGIVTEETGKIWYDKLVGGLRNLGKKELPKDAVFGIEFPQTFRINTQVYLQW